MEFSFANHCADIEVKKSWQNKWNQLEILDKIRKKIFWKFSRKTISDAEVLWQIPQRVGDAAAFFFLGTFAFAPARENGDDCQGHETWVTLNAGGKSRKNLSLSSLMKLYALRLMTSQGWSSDFPDNFQALPPSPPPPTVNDFHTSFKCQRQWWSIVQCITINNRSFDNDLDCLFSFAVFSWLCKTWREGAKEGKPNMCVQCTRSLLVCSPAKKTREKKDHQ